jgi:nucleotide-binding universal stress UspA family protein
MKSTQPATRIALKSILFLTDFSEPSEAALPFAIAVAREYGSTIHALHVLIPDAFAYTTPELGNLAMEALEEGADNRMREVDSQLAGVPHDATVVRGTGIWPAVGDAIAQNQVDLIVLGTHGRTGAERILLGSVAEEIFRRASVPVMTIGPSARLGVHAGGHFRRILFATDFSKEAGAALPYAASFAQENQADLLLLHAIPERKGGKDHSSAAVSIAEAMHALHELVAPESELWCRPEPIVRCEKPTIAILDAAEKSGADLIVLGIRGNEGVPGAATHLERPIAHKIVAYAACPVLTVRG